MHNIKDPTFFLGVVEDRMDPMMLGRVRVRVLGIHTHDKTALPTEDLPWAYKIQPTTSGAITGIGHAPVGVMEGTWVLVQYIDPDQQMPFVVGCVGGIPQSLNTPLESFELYNNETSVSDTANSTSSSSAETATPQQQQDSQTTKSAKEYTVSDSAIEKLKKTEKFKSCPYDDGAGVWTIGYGSTYLENGSKVTSTTPCITTDQADAILRYKVKKEFEVAVKNSVRVPITQSMYDAMVHMAYNVGGGGIRTFVNESGLNSGNYEQAATHISDFRVNPGSSTEKGLRSRRSVEKSMFLQDGIPSKDNNQLQDTPDSIAKKETEYKDANPGATTQEVQDAVSGYKRGVYTGERGFKDPADKYPLKTHLNEPDTNRLARHQKIRSTIVYTKELARHLGVTQANDTGTWDQSPIPYNARYPFNNVWQSESGHFMEFDDTDGRERVHLYHRTGTFTEVDHNGTQVNRIVGDNYEILERNGFVHVVGNVHVTVDGAQTLYVGNTLDIQVDGKTTINLHGDADLNVANNLNITTAGNVLWHVGGEFAVDAARIDLNSGNAAGLQFVGYDGGAAVTPSALSVNVRGDEIAGEYEIEDSEDQPVIREAYQKRMIEEGASTVEDMDKPAEVKDERKVEDNNIEGQPVDCNIPGSQTSFTGTEQLSISYRLSDLTAGYSRKLASQANTSPAQAFCNLKALSTNVLDPLKNKWPNMVINSGYRTDVPPGGSATSQHLTGQAVDVSFPGVSREDLYNRILEIQQMIPYDQLILEYASGPGWIHISFRKEGNRKQAFTMNHHKRVSPDMNTIVRVY